LRTNTGMDHSKIIQSMLMRGNAATCAGIHGSKLVYINARHLGRWRTAPVIALASTMRNKLHKTVIYYSCSSTEKKTPVVKTTSITYVYILHA
jgi:hypothetical protein